MTNGYVISSKRPPGFTSTVHVVERVDRTTKPHQVWTFCGYMFDEYELFDTFADVPVKLGPNLVRQCQRCH